MWNGWAGARARSGGGRLPRPDVASLFHQHINLVSAFPLDALRGGVALQPLPIEQIIQCRYIINALTPSTPCPSSSSSSSSPLQ